MNQFQTILSLQDSEREIITALNKDKHFPFLGYRSTQGVLMYSIPGCYNCLGNFCLLNYLTTETTDLSLSSQVNYVDFGNSEVVSLSALRQEMPFMEVPQQCLQLVLRGIEPVRSFGSLFGNHVSGSDLSGQQNFSQPIRSRSVFGTREFSRAFRQLFVPGA